MEPQRKMTLRVCLDFIILLVVGFPILFMYLWLQPYQRGFFCDDDSIKHPQLNSTVPNYLLYILGCGLPIIVMIITEYVRALGGQQNRVVFGRNIPSWFWNGYCSIGVFGFGAACSQLLTDIGKYTIGRLRPHFFTACQPNIDCSLPENAHKYFIDFKCLGDNKKDTRLSFPSGHSSFMTYTMVYLVLYLQARFTWTGSKLLRHFLQYMCLMLAAYTCLSRVSDYKHHPTDVLAGAILGALVAIIVATYISNLFTKSQRIRVSTYDTDTELPPRNGATIGSV